MDENRKSWPLIVGITAGILGGLIAGVYLYNMRSQHEPEIRLRDAKEIMDLCRSKIREIEAGLDAIRQPFVA